MPPVTDRSPAGASFHRFGPVKAPVTAQKAVPVCVEPPVVLRDTGIKGVVVSPFPVFGGVKDDRTVDLHLPGAEVPLKIGHIVEGVPEAELQEGENLYRFCFFE